MSFSRRKIKLGLENLYYQLRYGGSVDVDNYKINENRFSGKSLNIVLIKTFEEKSAFGRNNILMPLEEIGTVFKYGLASNVEYKNWYQIKQKVNRQMLDWVKRITTQHEIDVIISPLSGFSTTPEILKKLREFNIPMISYSLDDEIKFRSRKGKDGIYRGYKSVCKYYDLSLTTSKSTIVKYLVEGGHPMYMDYAGNEKIYKNLKLDKAYDVAFIGADYGIRREYVEFLRKNGIEVLAKGKGWEAGFAGDEEMIEIFNKAKIVLGFSTVGSTDDIYILKGRDFEVPLTGSFYITGYHEELQEYFDIGKDIETYTSKEDLLNKVRYYLDNEDEREAIALSGYKKSLNKYTAKEAFEKVFGFLGL